MICNYSITFLKKIGYNIFRKLQCRKLYAVISLLRNTYSILNDILRDFNNFPFSKQLEDNFFFLIISLTLVIFICLRFVIFYFYAYRISYDFFRLYFQTLRHCSAILMRIKCIYLNKFKKLVT